MYCFSPASHSGSIRGVPIGPSSPNQMTPHIPAGANHTPASIANHKQAPQPLYIEQVCVTWSFLFWWKTGVQGKMQKSWLRFQSFDCKQAVLGYQCNCHHIMLPDIFMSTRIWLFLHSFLRIIVIENSFSWSQYSVIVVM